MARRLHSRAPPTWWGQEGDLLLPGVSRQYLLVPEGNRVIRIHFATGDQNQQARLQFSTAATRACGRDRSSPTRQERGSS